MPIFSWSSDLDIGVKDMNEEHQVLLSLMNKLYDRTTQGAEKPEVKALVADLTDYTIKHFNDEEQYMQSIGFDDIEKHKVIHRGLIEKVLNYKKQIDDGNGNVPEDFFSFLKFWLSAHIRGVDAKYGTFAKTKKAA